MLSVYLLPMFPFKPNEEAEQGGDGDAEEAV